MMKLARILVGVDGSPHAARALEWAIHLGERDDAEVIAIHAVGLLAHLDGEHTVAAASHRDELEAAFTRWCAPLERSGVRHRRQLVEGAAAIVILDVARHEGVDLIVVGSRGLGATPAGQLGSTSLRVGERARRPVLVVPAVDEPAEGADG